MPACIPVISVQSDDFDLAAALSEMTNGRADIGAVVTFIGLCRNEGGRLAALEIEHYPAMAEKEIARIANQAVARWPLSGLTIIHRYGLIRPGENIVLVIAASSHRDAAFSAADFLMDYLKSQAPFWKKEHPVDDNQGGWVDAQRADMEALKRWQK